MIRQRYLALVALVACGLLVPTSDQDERLRDWCWEVRGEMSDGKCFAPCVPVPCYSPELKPGDRILRWSIE